VGATVRLQRPINSGFSLGPHRFDPTALEIVEWFRSGAQVDGFHELLEGHHATALVEDALSG
jgi:hypothetical protein